MVSVQIMVLYNSYVQNHTDTDEVISNCNLRCAKSQYTVSQR